MNVIPHPAAKTTRTEAPRLIDRMRRAIRVRHYSIRTEKAYLGWVRRFFSFTRRHHLHESVIRKAIYRATRDAGISKKVGCRTFRHSFATHLLMAGYDIRTIHKLFEHKDVKTTKISTYVLNMSGGRGIVSPADTHHSPGQVRP